MEYDIAGKDFASEGGKTMNLPRFAYHAPASLNECIALLADLENDAQVVAGGSDLLIRMKLRLTTPGHLVSLTRIQELAEISYDENKGLIVGSGVILSDLVASPLINEKCGVLARTAELVATKQVRNFATLGGNVLQGTRCAYYNRSPVWGKAVARCIKRGGKECHVVPKSKRCFAVYQGDMAPILIALGARAVVISKNAQEEVGLETIFTDDGGTPFRDLSGKIIMHFIIPASSLTMQSAYRKYRLREAIDFPLAGVAVALERDRGPRICLTGVQSSPVLLSTTSTAIPIDRKLARELGNFAYGAVHPLRNLEGEPSHRRSMVRIMVEDIVNGFSNQIA